LYGYEIWALTLRKECTLRMMENRVLRRIFGPKRDKIENGVLRRIFGTKRDKIENGVLRRIFGPKRK